MKKLTIAIVVALAAATGIAGAGAASAGQQVVAQPCCKYIG